MPLVIAVMAGLSVALLTGGLLRTTSPQTTVRRRLQDLGGDQTLPEHRSFMERVVIPIFGSLFGSVASMMPSGVRRTVEQRLQTAGLKVTAGRFLAYWFGFGAALPLGLLLLVVASTGTVSAGLVIICTGWMAMGVVMPGWWLSRKARARTDLIDRTLADAMDLIVTNIESGVGLQAALHNVAQKFHGPLAEDLGRALREIGLGRPRDEALDGMAKRSGSRELAMFTRSIGQAERNGIPIARVLRSQASEMRERRRQAARERANTFPLRITLLSVVFIFPTLFLLILGPVALDVFKFFAS